MDFVASAANIQAINSEISPVEITAIKKIAGKMTPAIVTTKVMICSLVALDMYKVHPLLPNPIEEVRFANVNSPINTFSLSERLSCATKDSTRCPANGLQVMLWTK
jgi:ubiquitin-activating enzyme E1